MTLSEILDAVLLESSVDTENVYYASTDPAVRRLVAMADRSASRLAAAHDWQALRRTYTLTLDSNTDYALPSDFGALVADTAFQDSYIHPIDMRTDPEYWGYLQSASSGVGPRARFRILGDRLHVYAPQSGQTVRYEYLSNHPIVDTDGTTTKQRWEADTDTFRLDDDLLVMDLVWRYQRLIGLEAWQDHRTEFMSHMRTVKGREAGAKTIIGGEYDMRFGEPYTDLWLPPE